MSLGKRIGLTAFARRVANLGGDLELAVGKGLDSAGMVLKRYVVEEIDTAMPYPANDRGMLRASVEERRTWRTVSIVVTAPHAAAIEDGTRPFWAPIGPLLDWVKRKGIGGGERPESIAYAIQHKIARDGIKPRHYFAKAFARFKNDNVVAREVGRELDALARANGGA